MCGAISTKCKEEGCNEWVRYTAYCETHTKPKKIFLRRGE